MQIPTLHGTIKRRILVNYCAEPQIIQKILPEPFRPKLQNDLAIAGICLIRLEHVRPNFVPEFIGLSSENAAHRIAVEWRDADGKTKEGVYIPRRDTNSLINSTIGGTLFPSEQHKANFAVAEDENTISFAMQSNDGEVSVKLKGKISARFPENSVFSSLNEASKFFEKGSLGYSVNSGENHLDGIVLEIKDWTVAPLRIEFVESSFYNDLNLFPKGSIKFDHALLMRNIQHEWHSAPSFALK